MDVTDHIGALYLDLRIPASGSLKSKRRVLKSIKDRVRNHYNVSIAEISEADKWQRSILGVCAISQNKNYLDQQLQSILSFIGGIPDIELVDHEIQFM